MLVTLTFMQVVPYHILHPLSLAMSCGSILADRQTHRQNNAFNNYGMVVLLHWNTYLAALCLVSGQKYRLRPNVKKWRILIYKLNLKCFNPNCTIDHPDIPDNIFHGYDY
jgi:hypothetical protein